jgi:hypothetical protein
MALTDQGRLQTLSELAAGPFPNSRPGSTTATLGGIGCAVGKPDGN